MEERVGGVEEGGRGRGECGRGGRLEEGVEERVTVRLVVGKWDSPHRKKKSSKWIHNKVGRLVFKAIIIHTENGK